MPVAPFPTETNWVVPSPRMSASSMVPPALTVTKPPALTVPPRNTPLTSTEPPSIVPPLARPPALTLKLPPLRTMSRASAPFEAFSVPPLTVTPEASASA